MTDTRDLLRLTMAETATDEREHGNATYAAVRPSYVPTPIRKYVLGIFWRADCSSGARDICWWTPSAPDPFQNGWAPFGNSSTIWMRLHHEEDWAKAEIGDFFTFGYWTGEHHVVMVYDVSNPKDPMVWGFGGQGQPHIVPLSQEIAFQGGRRTTLCKAQIVDPPPTPAEMLQAMTGFYSWMAWREGEGPWKHWGPLNKGVRPNVPRVISAQWWARRVQFLANRKKPNAAPHRNVGHL